MTEATQMKLSNLQAHALGVLCDVGIADGGTIANHLLVDGRRIGPVLGGLEKRGLIERTYTGHRYRGHAYYATDKGHAVCRAEFGDDDGD